MADLYVIEWSHGSGSTRVTLHVPHGVDPQACYAARYETLPEKPGAYISLRRNGLIIACWSAPTGKGLASVVADAPKVGEEVQ